MDQLERIKNALGKKCNVKLALFVFWLAMKDYSPGEISRITKLHNPQIRRYVLLVCDCLTSL